MKKLLLYLLCCVFVVFPLCVEALSNKAFQPKIHLCGKGKSCKNLPQFEESIKQTSGDLNTTKKMKQTDNFGEYATDIVAYLLTFVYVLAVIIIIYAGFNVLTAAGDEEKASKSKKIILFTIIGIIIIYLAGPITRFVLSMLEYTPL